MTSHGGRAASDGEDPPWLVARGVSVRHAGRAVLHDVDVSVERGEVLAVLGPNGAGKSTLLSVLGGLLATAGGSVTCHGRVATALQSAGLARGSAVSNVERALSWWGVPHQERSSRARQALDALHVGHLADRDTTAMSGGEQRRIHLARAVALRPDVLALDEPFAGLDPVTLAQLRDDSASVLRGAASSVVVVLHERADAWALADRLLVLLDGRVAAVGTPRDLLAAPPSPDVARFLGYDGELHDRDSVLLTRPAHVRLDPDGPLAGRVEARFPLEDGVRLRIRSAAGELTVVTGDDAPAVGDQVRLRVTGGVRFRTG